MLSLKLGPLAIPTHLAILYAGLLLAWLTGWWLGRKRGANPESALFNLVLLGALSARLAFVIGYADLYADNWLSALDIRDGGFDPLAGMLAALLGALWYLWRTPALRLPLAAGLATGILASGLGFAVLHALTHSQQLPDLALRTLDGEPISLHQLRGKPLVINLWASWCPPCRREMPVLQAAQQQNPHLEFVFVNQGEGQQQVIQFLQQQGISLDTLLLDSGARLGQSIGSLSLPTTLFYDAAGSLQTTHLGELSSASLRHAMRTLNTHPQPPLHKDTP
ncbi:MAG: TlpA family protein disulfide reductase [Thiopseudomonas sp.]|nr:TlpA family protein disulfide reductase [Thiopseudomonas sp.]